MPKDLDPFITVFTGGDIDFLQVHDVHKGETGIATEYEKVAHHIQLLYRSLVLYRIQFRLCQESHFHFFIAKLVVLEGVFADPGQFKRQGGHFAQANKVLHHTIVVHWLLVIDRPVVAQKNLKIDDEFVVDINDPDIGCISFFAQEFLQVSPGTP